MQIPTKPRLFFIFLALLIPGSSTVALAALDEAVKAVDNYMMDELPSFIDSLKKQELAFSKAHYSPEQE